MLVIKPRYHTGSGLFGNLFKKITKDSVKKVIKHAVSSPIAHKVADAVVKGAVTATEKVVENTIIDKLKKRPAPSVPSQLTKRQKIDTIINGSGLEEVVEKAIIKKIIGTGIVLD